MDELIKVIDKIAELSLYGLAFIIPFSKAGIEIFATIAIIAWISSKLLSYIYFRQHKKEKAINPFRTPLSKPIAILFAISLISVFFSVDIKLAIEGVFLKLSEYTLLFFICADILSKSSENGRKRKILLALIILSVTILFADGLFQWVTGKDFIRGFSAGRLKASFSNPNDFAGYIIAVLPALYCMLFIKFEKLKPKLILTARLFIAALFITGVLLLAMAFTRGAWLAFGVSLIFVLVTSFISPHKRFKAMAFLAIILLVVFLASALMFSERIEQRIESMSNIKYLAANIRFHLWQEAVGIIEDFPIFGAGPNTYSKIAPYYKSVSGGGIYPHNSYLHMAAEIGILGLLAFLWVLWRFFKQGFRMLTRLEDSNEALLLLGIMAGLLAFLVQSFFDTNLFALRLVMLFWVMMGIGVSLYKQLESDAAR